MANTIDNLLSVIGEPAAVAAFVLTARGRHPRNGDAGEPTASGQGRYASKPEGPVNAFNFHTLVPLPADYSINPYGDGSERSGFKLEVETWGIKWGSYAHGEPVTDPGAATYSFQTAWDGPHEVFMPKVSLRFPDLLFLLSWGGEGPTRGRALFAGGLKTGGLDGYRDEDYRDHIPAEEKEDEPGAWDAHQAVQNARLIGHPLWLALTLTRWLGTPFDSATPALVLADWLQDRGLNNHASLVRGTDPEASPFPLLDR